MASGRPTFKVSKRSDFGLPQLPPPAARGPRAGRRLQRRRRGARLPGRPRDPHRAPGRRPRALSTSRSRAATPSRWSSRSSSSTRCAASSSTSTCPEVRLDEAIQAEVAIELDGAEESPGVKEGGVLEHVTREITVEALPTEIPDEHPSTSRRWTSTTPCSSWRSPRRRASRSSPTTRRRSAIATLSPPRMVEEEPEVEEEAELVGEEGEAPRARTPAEGARAATRRRRGVRPAPVRRPPRPSEGEEAGATSPGRWLVVGLGNPGERVRGDPPQRRLRGRGRSCRALGAARGRSRSSAA